MNGTQASWMGVTADGFSANGSVATHHLGQGKGAGGGKQAKGSDSCPGTGDACRGGGRAAEQARGSAGYLAAEQPSRREALLAAQRRA